MAATCQLYGRNPIGQRRTAGSACPVRLRSSRARYWILRAGTPRMKRLGGANSPLSHVSYTGSFKVHKRLVTPRAVTADSDTRPLNFK